MTSLVSVLRGHPVHLLPGDQDTTESVLLEIWGQSYQVTTMPRCQLPKIQRAHWSLAAKQPRSQRQQSALVTCCLEPKYKEAASYQRHLGTKLTTQPMKPCSQGPIVIKEP